MTQETEFEEEFARDIASLDALARLKLELIAYRGPGTAPRFMDDIDVEGNSRASIDSVSGFQRLDADVTDVCAIVRFVKLCDVSVDQSSVRDRLVAKKAPDGGEYWSFHTSVVLMFGGTELKALCKWRVDVSFWLLKNATAHSGIADS